jgi:amino acid transporter/mannitol/fructose-specific phosphotransferase system IIA component (Ntr-type)
VTKLKRELGFWDVFAVSAGAMISSGLFILPALAYARTGSSVVLAYLLASILVIPSVLSKSELATAMPRAGGTYFFVDRSLGPVVGLFSGLAGWFSLALKSAFAIVGMAILVDVLLNHFAGISLSPWQQKGVGVVCCLIFTVLNVVSTKHSSRFQIVLLALLLLILVAFILGGLRHVEMRRFEAMFRGDWLDILACAGLVFVSFGGLTKVASIAEEVKRPGRDIPLGMIAACAVVTLIYLGVVSVTVGVLDGHVLAASSLPISAAARHFWGPAGFGVLAVAAIAAFVTTANGGILAASRSPLAMSRDQLLPASLSVVSPRFHTPIVGILVTGGFMMAAIVFLDMEKLVKTASTLMILLFLLDNLSVIVMRESRIQSYRPKFNSPFYPLMHIAAIVVYAFLIIDMGPLPLFITGGFFLASVVWYLLYAQRHVQRASAMMHIVERVTDKALQSVTLEDELRDILLERDQVVGDRFDRLVRDCHIIDLEGPCEARDVFKDISLILEQRIGTDRMVLLARFLEREHQASTVVQPGFAIPHVVVEGDHVFDVALVRAREGIRFPAQDEPVHIMFVLVGSPDERNYHLRALMAIAQIAQEPGFEGRWMGARDAEALRNLILLSTRKRDLPHP